MENSTNSLEKSEPQKSKTDVMGLISELYQKREIMPMQAEPEETGQPEE